MFVKLVALFAVLALSFMIQLGNFWFTYGIWPRSWGAFAFFTIASIINYSMLTRITKEITS